VKNKACWVASCCGRESDATRLARGEARRIAANVARLPDLVQKSSYDFVGVPPWKRTIRSNVWEVWYG